jgi:hypothetical protein
MLPGVLFARITATEPIIRRGQFSIHAPTGEKSRSSGPRHRQRRASFAITSIEQNSKSP